jgi:tetratricopeptide (TPR) repeat protein
MAYLDMGSVDQADRDFAKALQLDPKQVGALEGKGIVAVRKGDTQAAIAAFTQALEIKPDSVDVLFDRSNLFAKQHKYDLALKDMDALIAAAPNNASALNSRCWFRAISGGDANQALADCDTSLKIESSAATFDSRGLVYLRLGRFDEALADYDVACKGRPNQAGSIFGRGLSKLRKGQVAEGQADLTAARALDSKVDSEYADYGLKP